MQMYGVVQFVVSYSRIFFDLNHKNYANVMNIKLIKI